MNEMYSLKRLTTINTYYAENEALKDLVNLSFADGLHTGRWEDESAIDDSSEEYLTAMIALAEKYHIEYDKDLSYYIEDKKEAECYTWDRMGLELKELVELKLLEIIKG